MPNRKEYSRMDPLTPITLDCFVESVAIYGTSDAPYWRVILTHHSGGSLSFNVETKEQAAVFAPGERFEVVVNLH